MTQTCEIKTRLTLLTKSFCSRMGIQTTPLDAALRLSDAEVVKDLYQLWLEAGHEGTLDDFLLTFKGDQGDSNYQLWLDEGNVGTVEDFFATLHGKDIELRLSETHIQWKYVQDGEETWTNLIAREDLKGDEIQIGVTETHIIWKYDNETVWNNLISLAEITGPQGEQGYSLQFTWDGTSLGIKREDEIEYQYSNLKGEQGIQGIAGREVVFHTSETHIQWKYADEVIWNDLISLAEITGPQGIQGIAGREVQIQSDDTYIQWKYADEVEWNNIVLLESLRGPQGIQGIQGIAGSEVEIQNSGTHIQWRYVGDETWNDIIAISTITGVDGIDGEEIQLQKSLTHIQYKYESDVEWTDLVALADLKGDAGEEIQLQVNETHIQWKYTSDVVWTDLIALSALTGEQGIQGIAGEEILLQNNGTYIQWKYTSDVEWTNLVEIASLTGADGVDGEEIQLQVNETHIQWKYTSDVIWSDLIALSALQGPVGETGADGEQILLQNNGTHVQWKYESDIEWIDLVNISTLTGADGQDGLPGEKVELRVNNNYIEYKYESDVEWTQLFDLSQLQGADGQDGLSAYEIWLNNGGFGTEAVFLTSLVGFKYRADEWVETAQYTIGEVININGNSYACKTDHTAELNNRPESGTFWDSYWFLMAKGGLSAYEIWLNNGGSGTEQDFLNSLQGEDGQIGADGDDGISIVWQGSLASAPENPELNWGYYNTTDGKSYIWDGDSWEIIAQDGTGGSGGDVINDEVVALDTTWSSSKIDETVGDVEDIVDDILDGSTAINGALPVGGTTGQILVKKSATDYDAEWTDKPYKILFAWDGTTDTPFSQSEPISMDGVSVLEVFFNDVTMSDSAWRCCEFSFDGGTTWEIDADVNNYEATNPSTGIAGATDSGDDTIWFLHSSNSSDARSCFGIMWGLGQDTIKFYRTNRDQNGVHLNRSAPTHLRIIGVGLSGFVNFNGGKIIVKVLGA